jgi:hypothetical protein
MSKNESKTANQKYNPFGRTASSRSAMDILKDNFGIGIRDFDRGAEVWDESRVNEKTGKPAPGWVHVPNVSRECVIEFALNEGKGTGRQCVPASEFRQYVDALQEIVASDFAERVTSDRSEYIPTWKVAKDSFRMVRGRTQVLGSDGKMKTEEDKSSARDVVSIRCTSGKGAKPVLVPKDEFQEVVEALDSIANRLPEYETQAWDSFNAQIEAGETPDTSMPSSEE